MGGNRYGIIHYAAFFRWQLLEMKVGYVSSNIGLPVFI